MLYSEERGLDKGDFYKHLLLFLFKKFESIKLKNFIMTIFLKFHILI